MEGFGTFRTYTATEAAQAIGVSRSMMYRMIQDGEVRALDLGQGHRMRISETELARVSGNAEDDGAIDDVPQTITVRDACRLTGLSLQTIYDAIDSGRLPAFMPTGARRGIRIRRADLVDIVCGRKTSGRRRSRTE